MQGDLYGIFADRRSMMRDFIVKTLRSSDAPHYREIDLDLLTKRVDRLVEAFLEGLSGDGQTFVEYVERLAEERLLEGYYLEEVQRVLNLLWSYAWDTLAASERDDALIEKLATVCRLVGRGKDVLARTYLKRACDVNTRAQLLEQRILKLLGKESRPEDREE